MSKRTLRKAETSPTNWFAQLSLIRRYRGTIFPAFKWRTVKVIASTQTGYGVCFNFDQ